MLISWCLPCHKRTADLLKIVTAVNAEAAVDGDVEVVLVDYGNNPPLRTIPALSRRERGCWLIARVEAEHYHMSHARNVSIRVASGDCVVITSADIYPLPGFFAAVRQRIADTGALYLTPADDTYRGVLIVARHELIKAGGFDERIRYYGAEDKDLRSRLERRGVRRADYDASNLLGMFRTPNAEKVAHYGVTMTKTEMLEHGAAIYRENCERGTLVANEGQPWGQA